MRERCHFPDISMPAPPPSVEGDTRPSFFRTQDETSGGLRQECQTKRSLVVASIIGSDSNGFNRPDVCLFYGLQSLFGNTEASDYDNVSLVYDLWISPPNPSWTSYEQGSISEVRHVLPRSPNFNLNLRFLGMQGPRAARQTGPGI